MCGISELPSSQKIIWKLPIIPTVSTVECKIGDNFVLTTLCTTWTSCIRSVAVYGEGFVVSPLRCMFRTVSD